MKDMLERFRFHARKLRLHIDKSELVLDIGSGNRPHPRANVLCDMFIEDDTHRQGKKIAKDKRFMVQADICNLPFKDKAFGYIIASHILEHIPNVNEAISELMRVANRGYIETPSPMAELIFRRSEHKWFVELTKNGLLFTSKEILTQIPEEVIKIWNIWKILIETHPDDWYRFYFKTTDFWTVQYEWVNKIDFKVLIPPCKKRREELSLASFPSINEACNKRTLINFFYRTSKDVIEWWYRRQRTLKQKKFSLLEILQCPNCKRQSLCSEDNKFYCANCRAYYRIENGVINFLFNYTVPSIHSQVPKEIMKV